METILNFSLWGVSLTNWLGLLLYWLPLALCAYGYTIRTWHRYQNDIKKREAYEQKRKDGDSMPIPSYRPSLTVGSLFGYALLTIIPIANLFAAIFDVAPKVFSSVIRVCERIFNQPLVPERD